MSRKKAGEVKWKKKKWDR